MSLSLRGLWIIRDQDVIFSRRFTTVEQRASSLTNYLPLPLDLELLTLFTVQISNYKEGLPVLKLKDGSYYPFVFHQQQDTYFCCLPLVEDNNYKNISENPTITASLLFLEELSEMCNSITITNTNEIKANLLFEIQSYLAKIMPFGKVMNSNNKDIQSMIQHGFPIVEGLSIKRPAWKPYMHRGKQKLTITIQETISCVQYDSDLVSDTHLCIGNLLCIADLEGLPDITIPLLVNMNNNSNNNKGKMNSIAYHTCVQSQDTNQSKNTITTTLNNNNNNNNNSSSSSSMRYLVQKVTFSPPLDCFILCKYNIEDVTEVPIRGFYQMKEITKKEVKLLVQLKYSEKYVNNFQYCEMELPFGNRGSIVHIDIVPTAGAVTISSNRKSLKWNIGQKFTNKSLEVSLPATVYFDGNNNNEIDDPFMQNSNSYVQLRFKIIGDTLSNATIDVPNINIYNNSNNTKSNPQIVIEREIQSDEYIIYNSLGETKYSLPT